MRERVPGVIPHDEARRQFYDGPWWREASALGHGFDNGEPEDRLMEVVSPLQQSRLRFDRKQS